TFPPIQLITRDTGLTKTKLKQRWQKEWPTLLNDIQTHILSQLQPEEKIYIVCADDIQENLTTALATELSQHDFQRCIIDHFGNTKGSNRMREAAAILFTSIQYKRDEYYRALALATGEGDVGTETQTSK